MLLIYSVKQLFHAVQLPHQAALAAGGIVFVNDALVRNQIELANGSFDFSDGFFLIAAVDSFARFFYLRAGTAAVNSVLYTALFILPIAFNC